MTDYFGHLLWAYRAVFKQTNAGGGTIVTNFTMNERTVLLYGGIGPNDYAANRSITGAIKDSGDNRIVPIIKTQSIDNVELPIPTIVASPAGTPPDFEKLVIIGTGENLQIFAASLAQNEELTINLRMLIRSWPPTVATTGSTGTVTTTTTYDRVI